MVPLPLYVVVQPGQGPQQGALARAAAPEQGDELAAADPVRSTPSSTTRSP